MARPKTPEVEITEGLQPQAQIHDTYIRPAPVPRSPLHETAEALRNLAPRIGALMDGMDKQQAKADELAGEAAFWNNNQEGAAQATSDYQASGGTSGIPPFANPHFQTGFQKASGMAQGISLDGQIGQDYAGWEGKTSQDPKAFDQWFFGNIKGRLEGKSTGELQGLLPHIREMHSKYSQKWIADRAQDITFKMHEATAAATGGFIDQYVRDGKSAEGGLNVPAMSEAVALVRKNALMSGAERQKLDEVLINAVTAKAQLYKDPAILKVLDNVKDERGIALSAGSYGTKEKLSAGDAIERSIRMDEERRFKLQDREDKEAANAGIREVTKRLVKDPNAEIEDELLTPIEKEHPGFRKTLFEYRKTIQDGQIMEDPNKRLQLYMDVMKGGGMEAVWRSVANGDLKNPDTFNKAIEFADLAEKHAASGARITEHPSFKRVLTNIQSKTADPNFKGSIFQEPGLTEAGRAAVYDAHEYAIKWALANPQATALDREKMLQELGERLFKSIDTTSGTPAYTQPPEIKNPTNPALRQPAQPGAPQRAGGTAGQQAVEGLPPNLQEVVKANPWAAPFITAAQPPKIGELKLTPAQRSDLETRAKAKGVDPQVYVDTIYKNIQQLKQRGIGAPLTPTPGGAASAPDGQATTNPVSPTPNAPQAPAMPPPGPHSSVFPPERVAEVESQIRNLVASFTGPSPQKSVDLMKGTPGMAAQGTPKGAKDNLTLAAQFIGMNEKDDRVALASFFEKAGVNPLDPAETPWCMRFVNGVLQAQGHKGTGSDMARSALRYGIKVDPMRAEPGDIIVFPRTGDPNSGHVAIVKRVDVAKNRVYVVGGNQGGAAQKGGGVTETVYPLSKALGVRRVNEQVAANVVGNPDTAIA